MPTILEAAGGHNRIPANLDGHSLWPFVERGEHVFAEQTWHDFYEPMRAIRTARYKLVRNLLPGTGLQIAADILYSPTVDAMRETLRNLPRPKWEFYDLEQDPWERSNLAGNLDTREAVSDQHVDQAAWQCTPDRLVLALAPVLDPVDPLSQSCALCRRPDEAAIPL